MKKKNNKAILFICFCLLIGSHCFAAENNNNLDTTKGYSVGINALYWQNKTFSKTIMFGGSLYKNTKWNWFKFYGASNYFEQNTLESFGGLNSSLSIESGTAFSLKMGRRFSSSLLTGIGYHRVHIVIPGTIVRHNTFALFGSIDCNYSFQSYEVGVILGSSIGRGPAKTFYSSGPDKQETLFSLIPKLGIQFKINF